MIPTFQSSSRLRDLGVDHGFGTRRSGAASVPGLITRKQVHGTALVQVPGSETEADALWSNEPGVAVGVVTADCVPLLLVSTDAPVAVAVHAGWRGSAAGIAERTVKELARASGLEPSKLVVAVGPHIGPCCYEIDQPVRERIDEASVFSPSKRSGHYMLDLFALNRLQLVRAGVRDDRIEWVGGCTACAEPLYYSYRRDGRAGRMLHWVRVPQS